MAKYCDALPLYRLEKILEHYGGDITRTSMANWIIRLADILIPLINVMKEHQLTSDYLQADDKFMWLIRGDPPDQLVVIFEYDKSRSVKANNYREKTDRSI